MPVHTRPAKALSHPPAGVHHAAMTDALHLLPSLDANLSAEVLQARRAVNFLTFGTVYVD